MPNRSLWIIAIALVVVAGLVGGVIFVLSLNMLGEEPPAPTLAPVAGGVTTATVDGELGAATATAETSVEATPVIPSIPSPQPTIVETHVLDVLPASPTSVMATVATAAHTIAPFVEYEVEDGDTVTSIALSYGVSPESILQANQLSNPNVIRIGQVLLIPNMPAEVEAVGGEATTSAPAAPTATTLAEAPVATNTPAATPAVSETPPEATSAPDVSAGPADWPPSLTSGDLSANYPLLQQTGSGSLLIHYQPGTYPAHNIEALDSRIDLIYQRLQNTMGGAVPRIVDVYLGGTLFGVNPSLQGFTQSYEFRTFVLVNGAFHAGERDYILGHELTHVTATHILGPASSTMIHEGLATYLPQQYLTGDAGYLPIEEICAAAYRTDAFRSAAQLSQLSYGPTAFGGHIRTFFHYNLSGCFVGYLLQTYGMASLDQVYDSGDYRGVYGLSLGELDAAWQATLETTVPRVDAASFVRMVEEIAVAYERYVNASAGGYHANYEAYLHLNQARLQANRGNLVAARSELDSYYTLME